MRAAALIAITLCLFAAACGEQPEPKQVITPVTQANTGAQEAQWLAEPLRDAMTAATFEIRSYETVFVAPIATWCGPCEEQLRALEETNASYVAVGIDETEGVADLREYRSTNGFTGRFTLAEQSFTDSLSAEFGPSVTNLQAAPLIHVCGAEAQALGPGVQPAAQLPRCS